MLVVVGLALALASDTSARASDAGGSAGRPTRAAIVPGATRQPTALEPAVAEHIRSLEASAATLAREGATNAQLAEAEGLLGQVYHAYALSASAEPRYRAAHRLAPTDFRWPYLLAQLLQQEARSGEALALLERSRSLREDYAPLYVHLGNLHLAQDRVDEAASAFDTALAIDESAAAARYGLGQVAMSRRAYADAVDLFSRVLAEVPDANRVHYVLALAYRGLGQLDQAQSHLARQGPVGVRVDDPIVDGLQTLVRGARLWLVRGRLAFDAGRYPEAADAFRKVLATEPDNVSAHVNLGTTLAQLKDVDGALGAFRQALALDSDSRPALFNIAVLEAGRQRHDEAVRHLSRLVELDPRDQAARLFLGRELSRAGRPADALAAFEGVRRASPDDEDAVLGEVDALTALGRHVDALAAIERSYAAHPSRGRMAARLAFLLAGSPRVDLRDPGRALPLAMEVYATTGTVGHGAIVAMALAGLGRCDEALAWQRDLIGRAEREEPTLAAPLRADLERYRATCR